MTGFLPRLVLTMLVGPVAAFAGPQIKRSPAILPPTGPLKIRASGFCASEAVNLYLGSTLLTVLASNAQGAISPTTIAIPANTPPGKQALTAAGQKCNDAASSTLSVFDDWSQPQFDGSGSSYNFYEGTISPANVGSLGQLWAQTGGGFGPLAVEGNDAYSWNRSTHALDALNGQTGATLWASGQQASLVVVAPALSPATAFVADEIGYLYGYNRLTGALKYMTRPTSFSAFVPPLVIDGTVFVVDQNHSAIYATNGASGSLLWSYTLPQGTGPEGIAVVGGVVYVAYYASPHAGGIIELNAQTGASILSAASAPAGLLGSPVVANSRIYSTDANNAT